MPPNVHAAVATAGARAKDVAVRTGTAIAESAPESVREFGGRVADATLVPAVDGIVRMIELVNDWAVELTDPENVLEFHRKKGREASSLTHLRDLDLADLDEVVRRLVLQWRSFGAAEGAALGALAMVPVGGGALAITADVVLMQILATAIATRVCYAYGFDAKDPELQRVVAVHDQRGSLLGRWEVLIVRVAGVRVGSRFRFEQDPLFQDDLLRLETGHVQPAHLLQVAHPGRVVARQVQAQIPDLLGYFLPQRREEAVRILDRRVPLR